MAPFLRVFASPFSYDKPGLASRPGYPPITPCGPPSYGSSTLQVFDVRGTKKRVSPLIRGDQGGFFKPTKDHIL